MNNASYTNPLEQPSDIDGWHMEGESRASFVNGRLRLEGTRDPGSNDHGDINALHVSYFRRRDARARIFCTCNLRKSHGFHMVAQGADPIPCVRDAAGPYRIEVVKAGPRVRFTINNLIILDWSDDGQACGPVLGGGWIGFRQMTPMVGEYANFTVRSITP